MLTQIVLNNTYFCCVWLLSSFEDLQNVIVDLRISFIVGLSALYRQCKPNVVHIWVVKYRYHVSESGQDGTGTCEMKGIFSVQSATVQIDTFLIWFGFHYFSKWISLAADFKDLALYNVHASSAWSIQLECVWQTMLIENSKTVFPKLSTWKHQRGQSKIWKEQK